jgi:hypothetical protein
MAFIATFNLLIMITSSFTSLSIFSSGSKMQSTSTQQPTQQQQLLQPTQQSTRKRKQPTQKQPTRKQPPRKTKPMPTMPTQPTLPRCSGTDDPEYGELLPDVRAMAEDDEFMRRFVHAYDEIRQKMAAGMIP